MTDNTTIQQVSELLRTPPARGEAGDNFARELAKKYPYFVPARYIQAAQVHIDSNFSPRMLAAIHPYAGNWLQFCELLERTANATADVEVPQPPNPAPAVAIAPEVLPVQPSTPIVVEPEVIDIVEVATTDATVNVDTSKMDEVVIAAEQPSVQATEVIADVPAEIKLDTADNSLPASEPVQSKSRQSAGDFILPAYTEDYFMQQGVKVPGGVPADISKLQSQLAGKKDAGEKEKALMVMMSFTEWLLHFRNTSEKQKSEQEDQKAMRTMWQKEKLAAAMEEENEEIPENVFEMAVNSITQEDGLASESLAEIYAKQQKYDKAIEMYRKLSLRNPQKNTYFARKIEEVLKEKQL